MKKDPRAAMAGGRLMDPEGRLQPSGRLFPSLLNEVFVTTGLAARYPDRTRYLIAPVRVRQWQRGHRADSPGEVMLARDALHLPSGLQVLERVSVRTGRIGIPFVVSGK